MENTVNLDQFLDKNISSSFCPLKLEENHFCVFKTEKGDIPFHMCYSRKDFYLILIVDGHVKFSYADEVVTSDNYSLIFTNPRRPYNIELLGNYKSFYCCLFTDAFLEHFQFIRDYPLFKSDELPFFKISEETSTEVFKIFNDMANEMTLKFAYKKDSLRNNLLKLICVALKLTGSNNNYTQYPNGAVRLSTLFNELLANQFPITNPRDVIKMRYPTDFANYLLVHVNHLNRTLKSVTGKTTSKLIAERLIEEARMLLKHTDYSISEIAWCLGFEELPHFINFFKRNAGLTPNSFRKTYALSD